MTEPDRISRLRARALLAEYAAGLARLDAAIAKAAVGIAAFAEALRVSEQRSQDEMLLGHPDALNLDLADAYWNPEGAP